MVLSASQTSSPSRSRGRSCPSPRDQVHQVLLYVSIQVLLSDKNIETYLPSVQDRRDLQDRRCHHRHRGDPDPKVLIQDRIHQ